VAEHAQGKVIFMDSSGAATGRVLQGLLALGDEKSSVASPPGN
jgi:hypothetical protein